ncbi:MAG: sensor histidine kinase, partial [Desulfobulbaceae bacterium]|nr:sensor histidine kinase [Desulfobulbaceae bacterium]
IPLGLLINELVSNSLKYAFPEGQSGNINITVEQQGENLTACISDDGIGITTSDITTTRKTLGLELVNILARHHLDGDLQILPGRGTGYRINFPHSPLKNGLPQ